MSVPDGQDETTRANIQTSLNDNIKADPGGFDSATVTLTGNYLVLLPKSKYRSF